MNKADVIAFFDRCAPEWDADMIRNEPVIQTILDNAGRLRRYRCAGRCLWNGRADPGLSEAIGPQCDRH